MNTSRIPSPLTLQLVRAMATDPASPPKLRAFHAARLADLERAREAATRPQRASAFSRFLTKLERETP